MACGKTTHENLKDASESVRHALIHALENKEESVVSDLYDLYATVRKLVNNNVSTNSTYMSLNTDNIKIDSSNYDASLYTNAAAPVTFNTDYHGADYINFGGDTTISGGESPDTISFG